MAAIDRFLKREKDLPSHRQKWCGFCKKDHPFAYGESNDYWLVRFNSLSGRIRYECRLYRKHLYERAKKNPHHRLRKAVSNLVRDCVAKHGAFKSGSFPKYVNWTIDELKKHLESKFKPGMSWDNYGEWHIDHVIPDSWFKYESVDDEDFKKSWTLNNLQPMWKSDNCKKGNRYSGG